MTGRILYTAFDVVPSPKGASTHILHFLRSLVNSNYEVHLITPGDGLLPDQDSIEGARVTRIPPIEGANFLTRATAFGEGVMEHLESGPKYDLVHYRSIWSGLPLTQAKVRFGYKTLYEVNGMPSIELKYHYQGIEETGVLEKIREQELATLNLSDAIVCISDVTRAFLTSLGASRPDITVIPNGANPRAFSLPEIPLNVRQPATIFYHGTLADWQGLEILLNAMPLILAETSATLTIVGRGRSRQRKALRKQVRKLALEDHVNLLSPVPHHEIPALVAEADLCVAPLGINDRNIVQGCCPIKILEYMAAGRPLVASNLPVVRELVRENIDGLLFWPGDYQDLAKQITRVLKDHQLAKRLAANASERARQRFTWHRAGKRLVDVYQKLLETSL